jgi:hypothetical protein
MTSRNVPIMSLFLISALALSGCGSYSNSFDCPIGKGLNCAPLSLVHDKIDRKELDISFPESQPQESSWMSSVSNSSCTDCSNSASTSSSSLPSPKIYWRNSR